MVFGWGFDGIDGFSGLGSPVGVLLRSELFLDSRGGQIECAALNCVCVFGHLIDSEARSVVILVARALQLSGSLNPAKA